MSKLPPPSAVAHSSPPNPAINITSRVEDLREVNLYVAKATLLLAPHFSRDETYELFDRLMGYSSWGARLDTWSYVCLKEKGLI